MLRVAIIIVIAAVLAPSSALPRHHKWHWSHPDQHVWSETAAKFQDHLGNQQIATFMQTSMTAQQCISAVGKLSVDGKTKQASYHLCLQEKPGAAESDELFVCSYTTAPCCARSGAGGRISSIQQGSIGGQAFTVTFYTTNNQKDLCYSTTPETIPSCPSNPQCTPSCSTLDTVCLNNTQTERQEDCTVDNCLCKPRYVLPTCCNCDETYVEVDGECKEPCTERCEIRELQGCVKCRDGYGPPPLCCDCVEDYYKAGDNPVTCKRACANAKCENGECTCEPGYLKPDCCKCDENYEKKSDGTCKPSCSNIQDIYFVVDATSSNSKKTFCQEMVAIQLITGVMLRDNSGTRIGAYLYPRSFKSPTADMHYFKVGSQTCSKSITDFHELIQAQYGINTSLKKKVVGDATLPSRVIHLLAEDIKADIERDGGDDDRKRVVIILTDGPNDDDKYSRIPDWITLEEAMKSLVKIKKLTLIAAGIEKKNTNLKPDIVELANENEKNAIVVKNDGLELGEQLIKVMAENGVICQKKADEISEKIKSDHSESYCEYECSKYSSKCKCKDLSCNAPTNLCSASDVNLESDHSDSSLKEEIMAALENVLVQEGIIEVENY